VTDRPSAGATELGYSRWGPLSLLDSVPDQIALLVVIGLGLVAGVVFREKTDRPADRLADAFTQHGYPWRAELINLGVVVRDEGGKQYWRLANRPTDSLEA
jgi:hypothetical protein